MNLLFTSAGRRDYLLGYFADALAGRGTIHVGNSEPICSAFAWPGPRIVTPPIHTTGYVPFLLDYCRRHAIDAIIPLFDLDLPVLAGAVEKFRAIGVEVVVSSPEAIAICNDKWETVKFLRRTGLNAPKTCLTLDDAEAALRREELQFPVVVKPRWGMGSIAVMEAGNPSELAVMVALARRKIFESYLNFESSQDAENCVLIQERLKGTEYGLDVLNDLAGHHAATSVKRKLAMRSGETDAAISESNPRLESLGRQIAAELRHRGNLDVDLFLDGESATILELNCRFGGGYPFTHLAGGNFPAAILAWLNGAEAKREWLEVKPGITGVKAVTPIKLP